MDLSEGKLMFSLWSVMFFSLLWGLSIKIILRTLYLEIQLLDSEYELSPQSKVQVKNSCTFNCTYPIGLHGMMVTHKDSTFTVTFLKL